MKEPCKSEVSQTADGRRAAALASGRTIIFTLLITKATSPNAVEPCSGACRTLPTLANGNSTILMASFAPWPVDAHYATASLTSTRAATGSTLRVARAL